MSADLYQNLLQRLKGVRFYRSRKLWFYVFYIFVVVLIIPMAISGALSYPLYPKKEDPNILAYNYLASAFNYGSDSFVVLDAERAKEESTDQDIQELADFLIFVANNNKRMFWEDFTSPDHRPRIDNNFTIKVRIAEKMDEFMKGSSDIVDIESFNFAGFTGLVARLDNKYAAKAQAYLKQERFADNTFSLVGWITIAIAVAFMVWLTREDYLPEWQNALDFAGNTARQQYWTFYLNTLFILFVVAGFVSDFSLASGIKIPQPLGLLGMVLYIPALSLVVRRLWDARLSPKLAIVPAVLAIGAVYEGFFEWSNTGLFLFLYLLVLSIIGMFPSASETAVSEALAVS